MILMSFCSKFIRVYVYQLLLQYKKDLTELLQILEYACLVWHTGLTAAQSDALESAQKRAMRIIYSQMTTVAITRPV